MKKNILMIGFLLLMAVLFLKGTKIQSVDEYYMTHMEDIQEDSETVTISIRCDTLRESENWKNLKKQLQDEKYVPEDGVILKETTCVLRKGDTVFDILKRACRYHQIQMEYNGPDSNVYSTVMIKGINYLYEFSCGDLSGWMYKVNGKFPGKGCSSYKLKDKDKIEWVYTCDLGKDVGDDYQEKAQKQMKQRKEYDKNKDHTVEKEGEAE